MMTVKNRIKLSLMIDKMNNNKKYCKKIDIQSRTSLSPSVTSKSNMSTINLDKKEGK